MEKAVIKIVYVPGLGDIVQGELAANAINILDSNKANAYYIHQDEFKAVLNLRSITNAFLTISGEVLNPRYISSHKSILGNLIEKVISKHALHAFKTFKLSCAGQESDEVRQIKKYIENTFKLAAAEEADLEIYIGKQNDTWEIGVRITSRPLTLREYRVAHMPGGMDPTIAHAMNVLARADNAASYLNPFSGSGTLLIEAGMINNSIKLVGFDIDGKRNAEAVKNIKKAGLIKNIQLHTSNIFDNPDFGSFDIIASDLPFGMQILQHNALPDLYNSFFDYCSQKLRPNGIVVVTKDKCTFLKIMYMRFTNK